MISKNKWKLLSNLKFGILTWAWGQNIKHYFAIALSNL
jgi:hypothetical protein